MLFRFFLDTKNTNARKKNLINCYGADLYIQQDWNNFMKHFKFYLIDFNDNIGVEEDIKEFKIIHDQLNKMKFLGEKITL